jgi:hypothetical protein
MLRLGSERRSAARVTVVSSASCCRGEPPAAYLFSALPTVTAAGPSAVPKGKAGPDSVASQQRHFLPEDLAGALKRLDDVEIDALLAAVTTEAERRGRRPPDPAKKRVADAKPQRRQKVAEDGAG